METDESDLVSAGEWDLSGFLTPLQRDSYLRHNAYALRGPWLAEPDEEPTSQDFCCRWREIWVEEAR
jgi:hypothetical protein